MDLNSVLPDLGSFLGNSEGTQIYLGLFSDKNFPMYHAVKINEKPKQKSNARPDVTLSVLPGGSQRCRSVWSSSYTTRSGSTSSVATLVAG